MNPQSALSEAQFVPPAPLPPRRAGPNRVQSLPTLSSLMIVLGGLVLLWMALCVFAILIGVLHVSLMSGSSADGAILIVGYSVFGIAALPVGIVYIVAGVRIRKLRSKNLAIGALVAGVASVFCGNVFCVPFSLGVLIYGMLVLTDARVSAAFARARDGEPVERIVAEP